MKKYRISKIVETCGNSTIHHIEEVEKKEKEKWVPKKTGNEVDFFTELFGDTFK